MIHLIVLLTSPTAFGTGAIVVFVMAYSGYKLKDFYFNSTVEDQHTLQSNTETAIIPEESIALQNALEELLSQFNKCQISDYCLEEQLSIEKGLREYKELNRQISTQEPELTNLKKEQDASLNILENAIKLKELLIQQNPEKGDAWAQQLRPYIKNYQDSFYNYIGYHYNMFVTPSRVTAKLREAKDHARNNFS